jgi:hypothetical protein
VFFYRVDSAQKGGWTPPLTALELTGNDSHVSLGLGRVKQRVQRLLYYETLTIISISNLQNGLDVSEEGRVIACDNVENGDG